MLFTTVDQIQLYLPVSTSFTFEQIKPFIKQAEDNFLIPCIGKDQYAALQTAFDGSPTQEDQSLIDKCQAAVASFAYMYWTPWGQVHISDAGIQIASTANMKTAFQWQIDDLEGSARMSGFFSLDALLEFLELNKSTYTIWAGSSSYTEFKDFFVNTTAVFNEIFPQLGGSRRNFLALKPVMKRVEDFKITPLLGADFMSELKTQHTSNALSDPNKKVINYAQKSIVYITIAEALTELSVFIDERGVLYFNNTGGSTTLKTKEPVQITVIDKIEARHRANGETYLSMLRSLILDNIADYPTYANSSTYDSTDKTFEQNPDGADYYAAI